MAFAETLRAELAPVWERILAHPFVRELGAGTLAPERFRYYLGQDYVFLVEYARVLGLAVARGERLADMARFAQLLHATLHGEMDLHRGVCREYGLEPADLDRLAASPTCRAYCDHLLRVAQTGSLAEIAAALLPCQWGYHEIALALAPGSPPDNRYAPWIATYTSADYADLAAWVRDLVSAEGERAGPALRARMAEVYALSSRYEWRFWEAAYRMEAWPV